MTCCLYRHFDGKNRLLYIGISLSQLKRLINHRGKSKWYKNIRTIKIEYFKTKKIAHEAENKAIKREKPLHNIFGLRKSPKKRKKRSKNYYWAGKRA